MVTATGDVIVTVALVDELRVAEGVPEGFGLGETFGVADDVGATDLVVGVGDVVDVIVSGLGLVEDIVGLVVVEIGDEVVDDADTADVVDVIEATDVVDEEEVFGETVNTCVEITVRTLTDGGAGCRLVGDNIAGSVELGATTVSVAEPACTPSIIFDDTGAFSVIGLVSSW